MSTISYPPTSIYATTPQTSWYLDRFKFRKIPADPGDTLYTLQPRHTNRPDILANELYGSSAYYWIFAIRNPALRADPIWNFIAGLEIYVPTPSYLKKVIGS